MAFIRVHRRDGINYYAKCHSKRVKGQKNPVQEQLAWLGTYEEAWKALEQDEGDRALLPKLAIVSR